MSRAIKRRVDAFDLDGNAILDDNNTYSGSNTFSGTTNTFDSDVTIADGTNDFDVASHDGANGLLLGGTLVTSTAAELNNAADVSARVQELTASGAITAGVQSVELNHASVIIAATVADATLMQGIVQFKDTSASGTAAHTVTLTGGTFNAAGNTVATFNAPDETLVVYFDSNGDGAILINIGAVALA